MVRTITKRKSEGVLLPAKQLMTSSSPEPGRSSDGLFVQDAHVAAKHIKKRARKSEPPPKTRVDDEYDEDIGRTESQTFLALVEFESKKKRKMNKDNSAYMKKFEKDVYDQEGKLKLALADSEKNSTKRDIQFIESFKTAYGAARAHAVAPDQANGQDASSTTVLGFASMYNKSKEITTTAFALVAKFEEVAQHIEKLDTTALIENEWGEQDAIMMNLLQEGKQVGVQKYRCILTASNEPTNEETDAGKEGEAARGRNAANEDFFVVGKDKIECGWGGVAKTQVKAFRKLVKTLVV